VCTHCAFSASDAKRLGLSCRCPYVRLVNSLLTSDDPPPFTILHADGRSPFVFACDHAGRVLPRALGDLGLSDTELVRHIAWDIGIAEVGRRLADQLDAFTIQQTYSRLVIDCNRKPRSTQSIVTLSEATHVPGNEQLSDDAIEQRVQEIFRPYQDRLALELDQRALAARPTLLVSLHSFTPSFLGQLRQWHVGMLYNRDPRLGRSLLGLLRDELGEALVGDNQPYAVQDDSDYTVVVHGEGRGLIHVEIEIRQDLIAHAAGQAEWAERFARLLVIAQAEVAA
jgi:predicted N-formylglutamate amidohydrolase